MFKHRHHVVPAVTQPVPDVTAEDVARVVRRDFPEGEILDAMAILRDYGDGPAEREPLRVRMAVLKLANGSLEKLRNAVALAKRDYRNVLAPAEYPNYMNRGFGVRNLSLAERGRLYSDDWQQYERWLKK